MVCYAVTDEAAVGIVPVVVDLQRGRDSVFNRLGGRTLIVKILKMPYSAKDEDFDRSCVGKTCRSVNVRARPTSRLHANVSNPGLPTKEVVVPYLGLWSEMRTVHV